MKDLRKLKNAKLLSKVEQKRIKGGTPEPCYYDWECKEDHICLLGWCVRDV